MERVGVLCNLKTIGGKDWYRCGVDLLLPAQRPDGGWLGRGSGGFPVVDTCFALLFLKRSDLLPDLRETLQKRLTITDPGQAGKDWKGIAPQKSPGETPTPKSGSEKKSPGEKSDNPGKKSRAKAGAGRVYNSGVIDVGNTSASNEFSVTTGSLTVGALDPNGAATGGTVHLYTNSALTMPVSNVKKSSMVSFPAAPSSRAFRRKPWSRST